MKKIPCYVFCLSSFKHTEALAQVILEKQALNISLAAGEIGHQRSHTILSVKKYKILFDKFTNNNISLAHENTLLQGSVVELQRHYMKVNSKVKKLTYCRVGSLECTSLLYPAYF